MSMSFAVSAGSTAPASSSPVGGENYVTFYNYYKIKYTAPQEPSVKGNGKGKKYKAPAKAEQQKAIIAVPHEFAIDITDFKLDPVFMPLNVLKINSDLGHLLALHKVTNEDTGASMYVEGTPDHVSNLYNSNVASRPGFAVDFTIERLHPHVVKNGQVLQTLLSGIKQRIDDLKVVNSDLVNRRAQKKALNAEIKHLRQRRTEIDAEVDALQRSTLDSIVADLGLIAKSETQKPSGPKKEKGKPRLDESSSESEEDSE